MESLLFLWVIVAATEIGSTGPAQQTSYQGKACVILLHGLARTPASMKKMASGLRAAGFETINQGYDSRHHRIEDLSLAAIPQGLSACDAMDATPVHFVTHSMGGILVRHFLSIKTINNLGRVVMLSPPNHGSEVVDALADLPGFDFINGPAGKQLGTGPGSLLLVLGLANFELGVITGNQSINLINSAIIPGLDDGKVSVESAKLRGMTDFLVVPHSHPFIMKASEVIEQAVLFLRHGCFDHRQVDPDAASCLSVPAKSNELPENP